MRISEEMERGRESVLLRKGFPWRGRLPSEGPSRLLRVKAPLCRVVPRAANRNEQDCRWQSYLYCAVTPFGVTEGVNAADMQKAIVRYSSTKLLPYTPSECPCGQPPPPTRREAFLRKSTAPAPILITAFPKKSLPGGDPGRGERTRYSFASPKNLTASPGRRGCPRLWGRGISWK